MPEITKRKVTMTNVSALGVDDKGQVLTRTDQAHDFVRPDFLEAYVADAKTRWQIVTVSDEPDAGPGGYDGATYVPDGLDHPLAGQTFAATDPKEA